MSAETWEQSYAIKYINYEAEPGHVNLENPLQMTEANERRVRSYKKGKNKKKGKDGEFSVTEEGITEVVGKLVLMHLKLDSDPRGHNLTESLLENRIGVFLSDFHGI